MNRIVEDMTPAVATTRRTAKGADPFVRPFLGMLDTVLVEAPVDFPFDGSVQREHAAAIWTWIRRDVAPDLIPNEASDNDPAAAEALDAAMPQILGRVRDAVAKAANAGDGERRLKAQMGGEEAWARLPFVLNAVRNRGLLEKARAFGRAINAMTDEASLAAALQAMPTKDQNAAATLMHGAVGQVINPSRLVTALIRITGSATETSIRRAGYAPLIDALLAHAQNQIHTLTPYGAFADMDLTCRTIERFHKLVRAVNGYVELERTGRWATVVAGLTKTVSERIESKLREVVPDLNQSLRRAREGADRLDDDRLLSALNGVYLLATVRDCRTSLAVNALFDQTWNQVGEALEAHINRNLDALRANPRDAIIAKRLDTAIKMAELRFNAEYAEVLRRARDAAERRTTAG